VCVWIDCGYNGHGSGKREIEIETHLDTCCTQWFISGIIRLWFLSDVEIRCGRSVILYVGVCGVYAKCGCLRVGVGVVVVVVVCVYAIDDTCSTFSYRFQFMLLDRRIYDMIHMIRLSGLLIDFVYLVYTFIHLLFLLPRCPGVGKFLGIVSHLDTGTLTTRFEDRGYSPSLASLRFLGLPQRSSMMRLRSAALRSCSFFSSSAAFLRSSNCGWKVVLVLAMGFIYGFRENKIESTSTSS